MTLPLLNALLAFLLSYVLYGYLIKTRTKP